MTKILITGSNGFLGSNLVSFFSDMPGYQVFSTSRTESPVNAGTEYFRGDLLDDGFVKRLFSVTRPEIVINTVSLVNVDLCDEDPAFAHDITVKTAGHVAEACKTAGSRLIYISTDHLFDGKKSFYSEDEKPQPVNMYGKTKRLAEKITRETIPGSIIVRTNFFGRSPSGHLPTFGEWVYENLRQEKPITLFTDYYFTPIEVHYLAEAISMVIESDFSGIINIAGSERCSKYEFGMTLAQVCGFNTKSIKASAISSASFKAPRQSDLSLSTGKFERIFHKKLPKLKESVEKFCSGYKETIR